MKTVTVIREVKTVYEVDEDPRQPISDEEAINIVKSRISVDSPLGIKDESSDIVRFDVDGAEKETD